MTERIINIALDFSATPGARYVSDGPHSGEAFRERLLLPALRDPEVDRVLIILDGAEGYATSFLEEAFGGAARSVGIETCIQKLRFKSEEEPALSDEILGYIRGASS